MKSVGIKNVGTLENKSEGLSLELYLELFEDELLNLYFLKNGRNAPKPKARKGGRNINRIGFRVFDDQIVFLGITLEKLRRGSGLSEVLLETFFSFVKEMRLKFEETGLIHKPVIAKILKKNGFIPESDDVVIEILPQPENSSLEVPQVRIVRNKINGKKKRTSGSNPDFYEVVPRDQAMNYPLTTDSALVELHTRFIPPECFLDDLNNVICFNRKRIESVFSLISN